MGADKWESMRNYGQDLKVAISGSGEFSEKTQARKDANTKSDAARDSKLNEGSGSRTKKPEVQTPVQQLREKSKSVIDKIKARKEILDKAGE